ncbi:MAG: hypothetical protein GEU96_15515 [Propionibacteriales bacterium]|nr:hypothetical protein [Propionibacteriales bacterium]
MLVAAAICPHPPLLIPEVAAGAATELDDLRAACMDALDAVLQTAPDRLLVVGGGGSVRATGGEVGGSMRRFGVDYTIGPSTTVTLPLSLTVGAWLLEQVAISVPIEYVGLDDAVGPGGSADQFAGLAADGRVAVLAMADLSAKLTTDSPGYLDDRAVGFDREVMRLVGMPDPEGLVRLDTEVAGELWFAGGPALAALGGAARTTKGAAIAAKIHYDAAPYGVGYAVASWLTY